VHHSELKRSIGFWGAVSVMVGVIIGSGIFRTPPQISAELSSPGLVIALWIAGGLLCLAGALTYAELAAMFPASGGVYVFLREGFGKVTAFVFGWSYLLLVKPFAAGGIAFIFGEHVNQLLGVSWDHRVTTTVMLLTLTLINYRGVGLATGVAQVLTAIKFGALAAIVLLTFALMKGDWANFTPASTGLQPPPAPGTSEKSLVLSIVTVMSSILWTYDGWADIGSIAGEVECPQKQLPRIYIAGTLGVIGIYVLVNIAYILLVPLNEMLAAYRADSSYSVAPVVMNRLIGSIGSTALIVIILLSTLGSSHSSIMTGARVSYAQARDGLLFRFIGHVHPRYATPDAALWSQVLLSIVAVWLLGSFQSLMEGFVFTMWIFYALAGVSIFVLRIRRPGLERPFKCPGYPVVPLLFVLSAFAIPVLMIVDDPWHTLPWIGVLFVGVPVYFIWRKIWPEPPPVSLCPKCRYDLSGGTGGICPECGSPVVSPAQPITLPGSPLSQ
jgi:APA family basic amino acid/polyamine antiporter